MTEESVIGLLNAAEKLGDQIDAPKNWQREPLSELTNYIVDRHHTFVRTELLRLKELLAKVCSVHSTHHPELFQIRDIFFRLQADLTDHMLKEERILFPYIEKLETAVSSGEQAPKSAFGTVRNPVRMMMQEHDDAEELCRLREVSSNYQVPGDGCISFRTLYQALEEFEKDLHQHVHLENNILFRARPSLKQVPDMKSNRRHESLIPLSREHHYGLLVCLRIHRGIENHQADVGWLSERADKVIRFFESDLTTHFEAEEEIVFPAMSGMEDTKATIDQLVNEHRNLERLVQRLRKNATSSWRRCFENSPTSWKHTFAQKNVFSSLNTNGVFPQT